MTIYNWKRQLGQTKPNHKHTHSEQKELMQQEWLDKDDTDQERAAAITKKLTTSSAVKEERARMSKAKPNCAAPRGWVASVRKTNNDLAGRSLPKPPSPTRQQLPRTKTTSWGRFESSAREAQPQQQISKPLAKRGDSSAAPRFTPVEDISGTCAAFSQSMPPMRCPAEKKVVTEREEVNCRPTRRPPNPDDRKLRDAEIELAALTKVVENLRKQVGDVRHVVLNSISRVLVVNFHASTALSSLSTYNFKRHRLASQTHSRNSRLRECTCEIRRWNDYYCGDSDETAAKELGLSFMTIYNWKRQLGQTKPNHKHTHSEQKELMQQEWLDKDDTDQERAAAITKKLTTSSAVKEERARMSKAKPNCAAPRGWVASVRKTNNDLAGRSLPKPPSPTRQQLPRTKTTSWGRFESSAREAQPQQQISKPLAKRGDSSAAPRFTPVEDISGTCAAFSQSMPPMRCPAEKKVVTEREEVNCRPTRRPPNPDDRKLRDAEIELAALTKVVENLRKQVGDVRHVVLNSISRVLVVNFHASTALSSLSTYNFKRHRLASQTHSRNSRLRECTCEIRRWNDYYCGDSG
ncbi:hypothetical protein GPALN_009783 [Globodera pallida]|nr:hypothetical protein GPALN_009783 [Globodera pallida]